MTFGYHEESPGPRYHKIDEGRKGNNILDSVDQAEPSWLHRPACGGKGAYPYHEGRHLIVMAVRQLVYADDSGSHNESRRCVYAGYRGSPGQWAKFNSAWRKVLTKYRVCVFHSKVFFNRKRINDPKKNPYANWSDKKASAFLGALLKVITQQRIYPVGTTVDAPAFKSFSYGERCVLAGYLARTARRQHRRPAVYHVAVRNMILDALDSTNPDADVHFIFARQVEFQERAEEGFWLQKKLGRTGREHQMSDITHAEPKKYPGLQAADLLGYHWYQALVRGPREMTHQARQTMTILTRKRNDMPHYDKANLEQMFADAKIGPKARAQLRRIAEPL